MCATGSGLPPEGREEAMKWACKRVSWSCFEREREPGLVRAAVVVVGGVVAERGGLGPELGWDDWGQLSAAE